MNKINDYNMKRYEIDNFLIIPDKFKRKYNHNDKMYWIYGIYKTDDINFEHPIYIGKTSNIQHRATSYYHAVTSNTKNKRKKRKIVQFMCDEKIENFKMKPIYCVENNDVACMLEVGCISFYNTIKNGFNISEGTSYCKDFKETDNNYPRSYHTANGKRGKSKLMFILNPENKIGYICTGLKLVGDILGGISKDNIKTAAKRGIPRKGFYMYYLNFIDFEKVQDEVKRKLTAGHFYGPKSYDNMGNSKESYEQMYKNFILYGKYIKNYLKTKENPENITIKYITQDDNNEQGYIETDPNNFLINYSNYIFKIYNGESKNI